ncbi:MAG: Tex family protein [Myxococcota bacterium]
MASALADALNQELRLPKRGIQAVLDLLADGATVPFIARYRKERTGSLDEVQIRAIEEKATYLRELEDRRVSILRSIEQQGKLTDELKAQIQACTVKSTLEDLYLPYRPKRRTKGTQAKERGLEPLAQLILSQPTSGDPEIEASNYVSADKDVPNPEAALEGARDILIEVVAEHAELRAEVRDAFAKTGVLHAEATEGAKKKAGKRTKFEDYYNYSEPVSKVPSHRVLALRRGHAEKTLKTRIDIEAEPIIASAKQHFALNSESPFSGQLENAIQEAVVRKINPSIETDVWVDLKMKADRDAVEIFASNLESLLLASPLGGATVIGVDPGLRTGNKVAVVDATGKYIETVTLFTSKSDEEKEQAKAAFLALLQKHTPRAVAIGNGTGGREIEHLIRTWVREVGLDLIVVPVSEAGASVYSASEIARAEFPDLDLTIRGAISIARRLQDPLAELVKIEPKSIGVGQYQHDVYPPLMQRKLHDVVESCVNKVGVELGTASMSLLSYVAGIGTKLAQSIVIHRHQNGAFNDRHALLQVPGMGPKTYEQAAGFIRVSGSENPLDASSVHPERYELVEQMAADIEVPLGELIGNADAIQRIDITKYVSESVGEPTLKDIIEELKKPGRDPRKTFEPPKFLDGVNSIEDLKVEMEIEGVVTNVTAFGAFVDIGVHQDGLVHVSELSNRFVKDPNEVVKVGDKLKVKVIEVDTERKRISLTAKLQKAEAPARRPRRSDGSGDERGGKPRGDRRGPRKGGKGGENRGPRGEERGGRSSGGRPQRGGKGGGRGGKGGGGGRKPRDGFTNNPFADLLKNR